MWKEYSVSFLRKNRASSISILSAALIASLLLSVLCNFFYNLWVYDVESVVLEEGDWQGRIVGVFSEEEIELVRSFANVEKVVVSNENDTLDLYFQRPSRIYQDMTLLSEKLGLKKDQVTYNYQLLSMYMIRIPGDDKPRMNFPFYMAILLIVCFSLVLIIHNSFAVSMNARIRQLGILAGIGATPGQICTCLIQEALALCAVPIIGGSLAGIGIGYGLLRMMNALAAQMTGRHDLAFRCHPFVVGVTILFSLLTVLISAWIPARKLAKLTPLEAIRGVEESQLKRKKYSPILCYRKFLRKFRVRDEFSEMPGASLRNTHNLANERQLVFLWLFGIEGELAGNALR
ncbi:MAG: FtsX-like permease family protein, partial [Eubacterium sp.]|nr:FtsX-like permease family protein [Eubacterium sp.]